MAMAAPLRAECNPTSFAVKPNVLDPIDVVAKQSRFSSSVPVKL